MKLSNKVMVRALLILVVLSLLPFSANARRQWQPEVDDLLARLERIERLLDSQGLQEMYQRLELLDQENRTLRGDLEQMNYQMEHMIERNRQIYLDMDQRLQNLESRGSFAMESLGEDGVMVAPEGDVPVLGMGDQSVSDPLMLGVSQEGAATSSSSALDLLDEGMDEQAVYKVAFERLKQRQYQLAIRGFEDFLAKYPGSALAPNAYYWMGEAAYAEGAFQRAANEFERVLAKFPTSPKADDAALKLGYSYYELQNWAKARVVLKDLMMRSSGSTVGRLAAERLKRMKREGN